MSTITTNQILLYFNILILVFLVFYLLVGFIRGTKKSLFYLIVTIIVFGGGLIAMNAVSNKMLDFDFTQYGWAIPISGQSFTITTFRATVQEVINTFLFTSGAVDNTVTVAFVNGVAIMLIKIVYFTVLILFADTVFKIIADIIWLIIRPKKVETRTSRGMKRKRPKPGLASRFGGMGIGVVKGAFNILLFCFVLAGVASVVTSYQTIVDAQTTYSEAYSVVVMDDSLTLVSLSEDTETPSEIADESIIPDTTEYENVINALLGYRDTVPGKVFGTIKIQDSGIDEYLFDELASIKVETTDIQVQVKFRLELQRVAEAIALVPEILQSDFSIETLQSMDKVKIKEAIEKLSELDIIKVVVPVGLEIALYSDYIKDQVNDPALSDMLNGLDMAALKDIDYGADFKNLGYAFVDLSSLLSFDADGNFSLDFLALDGQTVEDIFSSLGSIELVNYTAPILVSYVLSMDDVSQLFADAGIDISDLGLDDITNWGQEISQIGIIYSKFLEIGLTTDQDGAIDYTNIDYTKINAFTSAVFDSLLISNAIPVVADYATNFIPDEYSDILSIPEDVNWETELSALIKAAAKIMGTGILEATDTAGYKAAIDSLVETADHSDIRDISDALSASTIFQHSLNNVIETLLAPSDGSGILGDITINGLDSPEDWDSDELYNLLQSAKLMFDTGVIGSSDVMNDFSNISDDTISSLSGTLSSSVFITKNLSSLTSFLITSLGADSGITLTTLEEDEWTKLELESIFSSLKYIAKTGILDITNNPDALKDLNSEENEQNKLQIAQGISNSNFLTNNLSNLLSSLTAGMGLEDQGISIAGFSDPSDWTAEEIYALLTAAGVVGNYTDDFTQIINVSDSDLLAIMDSTIITNVLIDIIKKYTNPGETLEIVSIPSSMSDDEWGNTKLAPTTFTLSGKELTITAPSGDVVEYKVYTTEDTGVTYNYEGKTLTTSFTFGDDVTVTTDNIKVVPVISGEIWNMFRAVRVIIDDNDPATTDAVSADAITQNITSLSDDNIVTILKSKVISETMIVQLEEYSVSAEGRDAFISIPTQLTDSNVDNRSLWLESEEAHGELFNCIKAINILLAGQNIGASDFSFDTTSITGLQEADVSQVLESLVISETVKDQISKIEAISIPKELQDSEGNIDDVAWNAQNETKNLLIGVISLFSGGELDPDSIKIQNIIDSQDKILKSLVICETIRIQITGITDISIPEGEGLTNTLTPLSGWANVYDDAGNVTTYGEISGILGVFDSLFGIDASTTITSLDFTSMKLQNIINDSDDILKSLVISETIRQKIMEIDAIEVPVNEGLENPIIPLTNWKNTYDGSGAVLNHGEIYYILQSLNSIFSIDATTSIDDISIDSMKISNIINNRDVILESLVITATVKEQITSLGNISIPEGEGLTDSSTPLTNWKNLYDDSDTVTSYGEISHILEALGILFDFDSTSTISTIDYDGMKLGVIIANKDNVLKSLVISETIRQKLIDASTSIDIPAGEGLENVDAPLTNWKNTYDNNGDVLSYGEISNILTSFNTLFNIGIDDTVTDIDFTQMNLANIINDSDEVLKSLVISETIRTKIVSTTTAITVPDDQGLGESGDAEPLANWKNEYDSGGFVKIRGELSYLLTSIGLLANVQDGDTIDTINFSNITLSNFIDNRNDILHSLVISETLKDQVVNSSAVMKLPNGWDDTVSVNYITWNNEYLDTYVNMVGVTSTVTSENELNNLLVSIGALLGTGNTDVTVNAINSFNYENLFDDIIVVDKSPQDKILSSVVICETIIQAVENSDGNGIYIPNDSSALLRTSSDRRDWLGEDGELSYFINGAGLLIPDKTSLDSMNFTSLDGIFDILQDETQRETLLKSYIIADTLSIDIALANSPLPTNAITGCEDLSLVATNDGLNYRLAWHEISVDRTIVHKELWNYLEGSDILFGGSFADGANFDIDSMLTDDTFVYIDDILNISTNTNKLVVILESKILELQIANVIVPILTVQLTDYLNDIASPDWYKSKMIDQTSEYDTRTATESLFLLQQAGLGYQALVAFTATQYSLFDSLDSVKLAYGSAISRQFRDSIQKMYIQLFGTAYQALELILSTDGDPTTNMETSWVTQEAKLQQGLYDSAYLANSKKGVYDVLEPALADIIDNLKTAAANVA